MSAALEVLCTVNEDTLNEGFVYNVVERGENYDREPIFRVATGHGLEWHTADKFAVLGMPLGHVRCIDSSKTLYLTVGKQYPILTEKEGEYYITNDGNNRIWYKADRFEKIHNEKEKSKVMSGDKWNFHITSAVGIDFNKISKCLSYKNPVAFIDAQPGRKEQDPVYFCMIHDSIFQKAEACKGGDKLLCRIDDLVSNYSIVVDNESLVGEIEGDNVKARILKIVKSIKDAPYRKKARFNAEVTVVLPAV
jgi:hypothetical protein